MMGRLKWTMGLLVVALSGCPNYAALDEVTRNEVSEIHDGELLWLKQSMYVGQFYDDDRYRLLSSRPFEEIDLLRTVEGDPIPPPPADGIVEAGTRARIVRIAWPTGGAVFKRPLYSPRYATWVFLRVGQARGKTYLERPKPHIVLLPGGIPDRATFDQWFEAFFAEDDPGDWLRSLPVAQRRAIFEKRAVLGMDYHALTAALGYPDRIDRPGGDKDQREIAIYGALRITLDRGRISNIAGESDDATAPPDAVD